MFYAIYYQTSEPHTYESHWDCGIDIMYICIYAFAKCHVLHRHSKKHGIYLSEKLSPERFVRISAFFCWLCLRLFNKLGLEGFYARIDSKIFGEDQ